MLKKLLMLLKDNIFISTLKIGFNVFSQKGVERLLRTIKTNQTIQIIDVSGLKFSDDCWGILEESTALLGIIMKE
jgi:hypothetical protein